MKEDGETVNPRFRRIKQTDISIPGDSCYIDMLKSVTSDDSVPKGITLSNHESQRHKKKASLSLERSSTNNRRNLFSKDAPTMSNLETVEELNQTKTKAQRSMLGLSRIEQIRMAYNH